MIKAQIKPSKLIPVEVKKVEIEDNFDDDDEVVVVEKPGKASKVNLFDFTSKKNPPEEKIKK